jgi:threonine synthase
MEYISTRGNAAPVTAGGAIEKGLAADGGLYVPESVPAFGKPLEDLCALPYAELACEVLKQYLTDYDAAGLRACVNAAYAFPSKFIHPHIAPLHRLNEKIFFLELFHGPTLAFKDMALSLLPSLMASAAERERPGTHTVVLTATSGDTGKAALEGFANAKDTSIAVFYPRDGVSDMQKLQMLTQEGDNTFVIGVNGNFDDTQTGVKNIFGDNALAVKMAENGLVFSSANSINIGRLLPQIVYYVYAYAQLRRQNAIPPGGEVDFTVPTGNFGNILAGYYAKCMGLPVRRLICASNSNNVLTQFFETGEYNANRPFHTTISPSMDILVSSNLERLLHHAAADPEYVRACMGDLNKKGRYSFKPSLPGFTAACVTEDETKAALREIWAQGYLADPHTAVAYHACRQLSDESVPNVIVATASPYKFAADVYAALAGKNAETFEAMDALAQLSGVPVPAALAALGKKEIRHKTLCEKSNMRKALEDIGIFNEKRLYI